MIDITSLITNNILLTMILLFISSLPLYIGVRYVGGETGIVKAISMSILLSFVLVGAIKFIGLFAGVFVLIASLFVYQLAFKLSFIKALIVWVCQYLFVFILVMLILWVI